MKEIQKFFCVVFLLCISHGAYAQYGYTDEITDDWGLYMDDEEEEEKPKHKEYKNMAYLQYSPTQYTMKGKTPHLHFQEFALGYARSIQVLEEKNYFVELGANVKYAFSNSDAAHSKAKYNALAFNIPVNVLYKFYLSKTKDIAIAPYAGVNLRVYAFANEKLNGNSLNLFKDAGATKGTNFDDKDLAWGRAHLGWQTGVKFYLNRWYLGVSYSRDFPDDSKFPEIHESSVHLGFCF